MREAMNEKRQWWIITVLLCVIIFLAVTVFYEASIRSGWEKSNLLAGALSDVNKLLPEGNEYIVPINNVLKQTGYGKLQRITQIPKKEEVKDE